TRTPILRTHANVLIINLALCDLIFSSLIGFPMTALSCFKRHWIWGDLGCDFYGFVAGWTGLGSITCLAFISIDRYMAIVHPFYMLNKKSSSVLTLLQIGAVWSWALIWSVMPLFGWGRFIPEAFGVSCTFDYLTRTWSNICFNYVLITCGFFLPVVIIVTSYIGIVIEVTKSTVEEDGMKDHMDAQNARCYVFVAVLSMLKTAKVLACCFGAFLICWTPYAIVAQLGINGFAHLVTPFTSEVPVLFAKTSSIWNPLIYALSHPRYRRAVVLEVSNFRKWFHRFIVRQFLCCYCRAADQETWSRRSDVGE
ncbi:hypothetical protein HELRODRAFT_84106, partial [Helobdella robusta]|uniref:G-protein coupled receptors family 1 profile domain-containing protein n=1 Tax=Helobdella robusta TaxID=6412 RepID=T1G5E9_HELRO